VLCLGEFDVGFCGVSLCCVWDSLVWVLGNELVLCVEEFGVGLGERVCGVFRRVWCGFGGVSLCRMWDIFIWNWGSLCFVVFGRVWCGFGG